MNIRSAKSKGRRLQQEVVKQILDTFPTLTDRDVRSTTMGDTGEDIKLSEAAAKKFPYSVECKNQEKLSIWQALEQAESRKDLTPLLVFKRNRSETYCCLKLEDFMKLVGEKNA